MYKKKEKKLQCTYMYKKYGKKEIKMGVQPVGTTTKSYPALENKKIKNIARKNNNKKTLYS